MTSSSIESELKTASDALDAGDAATAVALYEKVLEQDSDNHEASLMLGSLYGEMGRIEDATRLLQHATELNANDPAAALVLAHLYRATGDSGSAISLLEKLAGNTSDSEITYTLATLLEESGDRDRALQLYTQAAEQTPQAPEAQLALAAFHMNGSEFEQAASLYREVLGQNAGNIHAIGYLSVALCQLNQESEAISMLRTALEEQGNHADIHYFLATALAAQGMSSDALASCEQACALAPDDNRYTIKKAEILEGMGDLDQAFDLLRPTIESGNISVDAGLVFARLSHPLGMVDDGKLVLQRLLQQPLTPVHQQNVADALSWLDSV